MPGAKKQLALQMELAQLLTPKYSPSNPIIIAKLKKEGADLDFTYGMAQEVPLISAIYLRNSELVESLLTAGANPNIKIKGALTPLQAAEESLKMVLKEQQSAPPAKKEKADEAVRQATLCKSLILDALKE
jgi:hypothetical protein